MKGVILAAGTGSRLGPLTEVTNKYLLPVGKYPMIYFSIYKLLEADIRDILVVLNRENMGDVMDLLGSGEKFGVDFTYKIQEHPMGIAASLGLAEGFAGRDKIVVILANNVFEDSIAPYVENFQRQRKGARILLKAVPDPEHYPAAVFEGRRLASIEERPGLPKSFFAVTGIYMYDKNVFNIIKTLLPSERGTLEITDVNNAYLQTKDLRHDTLDGWWIDTGTHDAWIEANELARDVYLGQQFGKVQVAAGSFLEGL